MQEFVICLKEELLPVFSNVGLYLLENWRLRTKNKKKDTKTKQRAIEAAIELVNLYIAEGLDGIVEKLKRHKKKDVVVAKNKLKYIYTDYIHPSYFKELEEPTAEIECNYCKKKQGSAKFELCSACKKVYYCSKDCQVKDWKSGHKTSCVKTKP